ncbi:unnamed protein product [Calypogeia fissa]
MAGSCGKGSEMGNKNMFQVLKWTKGVIVDSAKGFAADLARGYVVDQARTYIYIPAKDFIVDSTKSLIGNSSTATEPTFEDSEFYKSYLFYLERNPVSITTFHIQNRALVLNSSGGRRFDTEVGNEEMLLVMRMARAFIVNSLCLSKEKEFKNITLFVENMPGVAHTNTCRRGNPEIHLSAQYVEGFAPGDRAALLYEITGVLIHESTHAWQNHGGNYRADPVFHGVLEGIADFIRLRSGYPAKHWVRKAGGEWYSGYATTAFFFDWIERTQAPGFVNQLNFMMARGWNLRFIEEITGKSVDYLWGYYQASFMNSTRRY